jgi:gluconolactonase
MTGSDPAEPPTTKPSELREHRLNSPNDVVEHSDGSIWFTDPTYSIHDNYEGDEASSEIGSRNVYRLDRANGDLISDARADERQAGRTAPRRRHDDSQRPYQTPGHRPNGPAAPGR